MSLPSKIVIFFVRLYQKWISPLLGQHCRFYPSCSNYCIDSIKKYGCVKGGFKACLRVLKCNPFHSGGVDYA